ncbi:ErfK/YbiS/YcfS/YnhG family protein [Methylobacterium indicum]|uniref:ErfK/YbiS/YcfS/YnhG family protein n=1 Tax=Methylobacterium indicum TaxID=1775910 RepID=A0A0J6RGN0_9HYPH|nr:L,D-transpeptidase [Methylobacterium indicum]KMO11196.1 ErfK/YbiS/YcfS/YnhG family protein [Methylobacterium indicum]KMO20509.1 ErfK/YbiS/YcfS/YnhG family protein [Methylobacterium indicum]KTS19200.1 ErfK/YbiS/YcfS/YnhG family protein [Methylobacterium indicum]KTS40893.1 ErfK/YbiS/YcfS/YnhG family protein [Methylobacterium indicum]KTS44720.1 ErfK/YbiS/YcfS/YnhG family protein [Methylobacterium indicum]
MKIFATALAGVLSACVLASAPAKAAPYDPFDANPGEDYYAGQPYDSPSYRATQGYYGQGQVGQGQAAGSTEQAQVAPIPRELVPFNGAYAPGTLVVSTAERRLYLVLGDGMALRYGVGVGRPGFTWSGTKTITAKREWPSWTPPKEMLARRPDLPRYMAGGIDNPLGARAMYIGGTLYRIHGSNEPDTIGQAVSSGCIRMTNDDVTDLYSRVKVGAKVVVLN